MITPSAKPYQMKGLTRFLCNNFHLKTTNKESFFGYNHANF